MSKAELWLKLLLRVVGVSAALAVVPAIMPQTWLVWCVDKVEPCTRVHLLIAYLARLLSAYYTLLGVLLIVFAGDVRRYAPAIRAVAIWCLLAATFLVSSLLIAVPSSIRGWFFWFIFSDGCFGIVFAFCILLLQRRMTSRFLDGVYPDAGRGWE